METMDANQLWKLEYCNDADFTKVGDPKPTKTTLKEVPFIKNNPNMNKIENGEPKDEGEKYMTEK